MTLTSQVIITNNFEETLERLEALITHEKIIKIAEEEKAFSVDDAKKVIAKAYVASEELTIIVLVAKVFSSIVQNKLLKIIEEPPKNKVFILLTESKSTILPTIRSRLAITIGSSSKEDLDLSLNVADLSLALVYEFIQRHKRTQSKEMRPLFEQIAKEAMLSAKFDFDVKSLALFADCTKALDMGSPPSFILNTLLLKLLARKKH